MIFFAIWQELLSTIFPGRVKGRAVYEREYIMKIYIDKGALAVVKKVG